jgi:hypothetical protein
VRVLRALRDANLFLQNQREISAGLVEKLLKLDRRALLCSVPRAIQPRSHGTRRGGRRMDFRGTFRAKRKLTAKPQQVVDRTFAERARH